MLFVLLSSPLIGHEGLHQQVAQVTVAIRQSPRDPALYLRRGELHRLHRRWKLAERDYDQAHSLDHSLAMVDLGRGMLELDRGRPVDAIVPLVRYTKARADDPRGRIALARTWARVGRSSDSILEYEAAVALTPQPDPDLLLELTGALVAAKRPADALRVLDAVQPPVVTLQLTAIAIEVSSGDYVAALRRLDTAAATSTRKEAWLARRGDILMRSGRPREALAAYQEALDAIASVPTERRRTRALQELERRLRRALR